MLRRLFGPKPPATVRVAAQDLAIEVPAGKTVLEAALGQGIAFPHNCKVGTCGTCRYRLVSGKIGELTSSAMGLSAEHYQAGYRLACQSLPKGDLEVHVDTPLRRTIAVTEFGAAIASQRRLAHDVVELELQADTAVDFRPGQYADLHVGDLGAARSYSFASPPDGRTLRFHVRLVPGGQFSGWLLEQDRSGTRLTVRGPYGQFGLRAGNATLVCVAGGTGMAPIKCMLESMSAAERQRRVMLFFGARTSDDLYCLDTVDGLRAQWPGGFDFVPVLSAQPADKPWDGRRGMVTDHLAELITAGAGAEGYLCGPPPMVDAAEAALVRLGMPRDAIAADRFFTRGDAGSTSGTSAARQLPSV